MVSSLCAATVLVTQCTDVNQCSPSTCTKLLETEQNTCISLPGGSNNSILNASYAKFFCMQGVQACSPTKVYFNDSTCSGTPAETLWNPCGTCLQFPPRLQNCEVRNGTFLVRVKSCHDNSCEHCDPYDDAGLPPATCYAHPGVPGLYLEYNNLEACAGIFVMGFNDANCERRVAQTIMAGQGKCFGGIAFSCNSS